MSHLQDKFFPVEFEDKVCLCRVNMMFSCYQIVNIIANYHFSFCLSFQESQGQHSVFEFIYQTVIPS